MTSLAALCIVAPLLTLVTSILFLLFLAYGFATLHLIFGDKTDFADAVAAVRIVLAPFGGAVLLLLVDLVALQFARARWSWSVLVWPAAATGSLWLYGANLHMLFPAGQMMPIKALAPPIAKAAWGIVFIGVGASLSAALIFLLAGHGDRSQPGGQIKDRWPIMPIQSTAIQYSVRRLRVGLQVLIALGSMSLGVLRLGFFLLLVMALSVGIAAHQTRGWSLSADDQMMFSVLSCGVGAIVIGIAQTLWGLLRRKGSPYIHAMLLLLYVVLARDIFWNYRVWADVLRSPTPVLPPPLAMTLNETMVLTILLIALIARGVVAGSFRASINRLRRAAMRTAADVAATSRSPPILLLRSFADDERAARSGDSYFSHVVGKPSDRIRIEEIAQGAFYPMGPLIALANPLIKTAPLGAARDIAPLDDWQDLVLSYLAKSQAIVIFVGNTNSLGWEIEQVIKLGRLEDTLFVFPDDYLQDRFLIDLSPQLAGLLGIADKAAEEMTMRHARALVFDCTAQCFVVFKARRGDEFSYTECLQWAAAVLLAGKEARRSTERNDTPLAPGAPFPYMPPRPAGALSACGGSA